VRTLLHILGILQGNNYNNAGEYLRRVLEDGLLQKPEGVF